MRRASRTTSSRAFSCSSSRETQPAAAKPARKTTTSTRLNLSLSPIAYSIPSENDSIQRSSERPRDNPVMSAPKVLFGFHAVGVRLKTAPASIVEIYADPTRRDARMRQFLTRVQESGVRLIEADGLRLAKLAGSHGHQGIAARVSALPQVTSLDDLLDAVEGPPLLLVLDG